MARFSASARSAGAGSTTLPIMSLYAPAGSGAWVREVGVFNTTAVAVSLALRRLTTTGTRGAAITPGVYVGGGPPALMLPFQTHTVAPTLGNFFRAAALGAAIGSGVIWTFGGSGIFIPLGTANGIGLVVATGAGQICDFYIDWDE